MSSSRTELVTSCLLRIAAAPPKHTTAPLSTQRHQQVGSSTPNFDRMVGNPLAKQIPWDTNPAMLAAWREGNTGTRAGSCSHGWEGGSLRYVYVVV